MTRIAVLVSGGGTNLQAVIDAVKEGNIPDAAVSLVVSSNPNAYALERAEKNGIETLIPKDERELIEGLADADLIVLAGYMSILPHEFIDRFRGKIINIHPSLIPKHCGKGYYGRRVHKAVLECGDEVTGATVHFVDEGVDTGDIIMQEEVPVLGGDTVESLAARVLETEHSILIKAINKVIGAQTG